MYSVAERGAPDNLRRREHTMLSPYLWDKAPHTTIHAYGTSMGESDELYSEGNYNYSLVTQLKVVQQILETEDLSGNTGYFYTANSAAPLAHTLRGYFDQRGAQTHPSIESIRPFHDPTHLEHVITNKRLTSAVLIDQFVVTGSTLLASLREVINAGIKPSNVHPIAGLWYGQLSFDGAHATSTEFAEVAVQAEPLAAHFYMIGSLAAKQAT